METGAFMATSVFVCHVQPYSEWHSKESSPREQFIYSQVRGHESPTMGYEGYGALCLDGRSIGLESPHYDCGMNGAAYDTGMGE